MRKAKNRKMDKKTRHLECVKYKKEKKRKQKERDAKYNEWLELPEDQWSETRKKYKGVVND